MRVAILGCGYVGLEVARQLASNGHRVYGVRRSHPESIRDVGAQPVSGDITESATLANVPSVDALVFSASAGRGDVDRARAIYVEGLSGVIDHFGTRPDPPGRLLYTSSTGVFGDHDGAWVDESTPIDPQSPKTQILAEAEDIVRQTTTRDMTPIVARIAGIYGPDRWGIDRYLDGPVTAGYRNHIRRFDVAGAIVHLLEGDHTPELVLLADDEPVDRWVFADWLAEQSDRPIPPKITVEERISAGDLSARAAERLRSSKRVDNSRLRSLGYDLRYPTYREGYADAVG